jgi:hypothetical protein
MNHLDLHGYNIAYYLKHGNFYANKFIVGKTIIYRIFILILWGDVKKPDDNSEKKLKDQS